MIRVGKDSTRTWRVEYSAGSGSFDTYGMEALSAEVTDGGVLVFRDLHGDVIRAVSPTGWTEVSPR